MKRLFLLLILLSVALPAMAEDITLSWDASPTDGVTGYVVNYGNATESLEYSKNAGNVLTTTIEDLPPGEWFFVVKAYDDSNVSAPSNMVDQVLVAYVAVDNPHDPITIPAAPGTVTITIKVE